MGLEDEIDIGPQILVEYDKSGRAACKSARCLYDDRSLDEKLAEAGGKKAKIKGAKIPKGDLRIVKKVAIAAFGEHEMASNYHLACYMLEQTHARPTTTILTSTDQLTGFDALERSDQKLIEKMIERVDKLWDRWKKHNSRRTFTEQEEQERKDEAADWLKMAAGGDIEERHYDYDQVDDKALKKAAAAKRKAAIAVDDDEDDAPKKKAKKTSAKKKKKGGSEDDESDYGDPDRHTDVDESPKKKPVKRETKVKKQVKDDDDEQMSAKQSVKSEAKGVKKDSNVKKEASKTPVKAAPASAASTYDSSGYDLEEKADTADKKKSNYQRLMSRPSTLGMVKDVPTGASECLTGLTFVISGVLDSLTSTDAKELIEQYGGRVTTGVSKKTSYLLRGDDAGETKTKKADELGTKIIDEDGLFELLRTLPEGGTPAAAPKAKKAKAKAKKKTSGDDDEDEDEYEAPPKQILSKPSAPGKRALPSFM